MANHNNSRLIKLKNNKTNCYLKVYYQLTNILKKYRYYNKVIIHIFNLPKNLNYK